MAIVGGAAEISPMIALQCKADLRPEDSFLLWQRGVSVGQMATRTLGKTREMDGLHPFYFQLSENFQSMAVDEAVAKHARDYFSERRLDDRAPLARNAAMIIHNLYAQTDYPDARRFRSKMDLVLMAIVVGCIKSLIRNRKAGNELENFAWTFDFQARAKTLSVGKSSPLDLCQSLVKGLQMPDLMAAAACIWGGSTLQYHGNRHPTEFVGIVCPYVTLIVNVIGDTELIAFHGVLEPCISLCTGSMLILPQDSSTGYVFGGSSAARRNRTMILETQHFNVDEDTFHAPIFTLEGITNSANNNGILYATICAWWYGEVFAELKAPNGPNRPSKRLD